jgi:PAS domain S-box-containing protein
VGVPLAAANQPMKTSLWYIAALGVLALALSTLLAVPFGDRIARPLRALADTARQLGRGQPISPLSTHVREVNEVSDVLATASSELTQREAALRASEGRLRATHENPAIGVVEVDREGRFLYVNEPHARLTRHSREELIGRHFAHATHPEHRDQDLELFRRQVEGDFDFYTIEKRHIRLDGSVGWARVSSTAVRDAQGEFLYAVRLIEDITEQKKAEATQRLLVDELNHRVKNTLATVQALAYQSFRQSLPPEVARERFEARLMSLSRTHNLLNEKNWTGAALKDVVALELEPFIGEHRKRLVTSGPDVDLPARMAVVVGMIFHELATNAAKYGALSIPFGRIAVNWRVALEEDQRVLQVEWIEQGGPPVEQLEHRGFGSRLIKQAATQQLNGRADLRFPKEGVTCRLDLPLDDGFGDLQSAA